MLIKRRTFLRSGALATAAAFIPELLKDFQYGKMLSSGNKALVVIQLNGGNDGLNTVIPYRNDIYYRSRPVIGIKKESAFNLTDECGLHPALGYFKSLYDEGSLAILNNVGYPDPNRSHFRSMDIWHTASGSLEYRSEGWLGKYLDTHCKDCKKSIQAIEIADSLSLALKGKDFKGLAMKDTRKLFNTANDSFLQSLARMNHSEEHEKPVDYLYKTMAETISGAGYIHEKAGRYKTSVAYPRTALANGLKTIAGLILSDLDTSVYYISLGSFDTHVRQEGQQERHFTTLNEAIEPFVKELKMNGRFDDVMIMSFSEFGRRVVQNASGGTDHGTANNMFFISGALKQKGLLNPLPDLTNLDDGDLRFTVDFKSVYATILKKWMGADDKAILGDSFDHLNFI